ncbi:MAG: hypothetical protein BWX88_01404 [Planctomycetes bacterium ADurb.Bin126]|nr:MAG: hypothetical protein BWX88_01404 [Planctomycetes bacterium ADurb.Bin126]HOD80531.1 hypothetical protein [Phycisphaerae bacterium]HQL72372.1 hypothetical protein [Phycisphaerae bacterium]
MRWIPLFLLGYLLVLIQTSLGHVLSIQAPHLGVLSVDLLAILAVYVTLHARSALDAALAAWTLGLALDFTSSGGVSASTVIGPMALGYVLAGGLLYRIREAFFRERALTQATLTLFFCLLAHGFWVTAQALLAEEMTWPAYGRILAQAGALAFYTAAITPLVHYLLSLIERWFIATPAVRGQGRR